MHVLSLLQPCLEQTLLRLARRRLRLSENHFAHTSPRLPSRQDTEPSCRYGMAPANWNHAGERNLCGLPSCQPAYEAPST